MSAQEATINIKVIKDKNQPTHFTGGEFGISKLEVYIDPTLPDRTQRALVIHCVVENYLRSVSHEKIEELCSFIEDALDQLEDT